VAAALHGVLGELGDEIRSRFPAVRADASPAVHNDLEALFGAARRRLGTLGMVEQAAEIDEFGLDRDALRRARPVLDFLVDRYWRLRIGGREHVPESGPCLFVANRSGLLPFDGLVLSHAIEREHEGGERPRFLVADGLMRLPFAHATLAQLGGVRACRENARRLLASNRFVIAFPEGGKGATKVFRERYRLQRFGRGGAVRLALEIGAPIVPVGIVGAEEAAPLLAKIAGAARPLGLPFLPLTPTFPWLGPLGLLPLPSRWVIHIGEPISLAHHPRDVASDELVVAELTEDVRTRVRSLIDAALRDRESVWSFG
jgi:1-acyl-sn-glycerol-3-phosphate acyltransferase